MLHEICPLLYSYLSLGTPCSSWSIMGSIDQGTRSKGHIEGDGALDRELHGNRQSHFVAEACSLASARGTRWTIEEPRR